MAIQAGGTVGPPPTGGLVWAMVSWMIAEGLAASGETAVAASLHVATRALIAASGFSEYFDPTDGARIGGDTFSWTAAITLMLGGSQGFVSAGALRPAP